MAEASAGANHDVLGVLSAEAVRLTEDIKKARFIAEAAKDVSQPDN
jgi:hypothetical protein